MLITRKRIGATVTIACSVFCLALFGCGGKNTIEKAKMVKSKKERIYDQTVKYGTILGEGKLETFFGGTKSNSNLQQGMGGSPVAVNSFLWRATLDTLSFMPLASADPFGGVVITDWYTPPETPSERFKLTVYILSRDLRADGLRVAVFRQNQNPNGEWVGVKIKNDTAVELENTILTRAREMRIAGIVE